MQRLILGYDTMGRKKSAYDEQAVYRCDKLFYKGRMLFKHVSPLVGMHFPIHIS